MREQTYGRYVGLCVTLLLFASTLLCVDRLDTLALVRFERATPSRSAFLSGNGKPRSSNHATRESLSTVPESNVTVGLVDYCVGESYATLKKLIGFNRQAYAARWKYTIFSGNEEEFALQTFVEPLAWLKAAYFYHLLSSAQTQDIEWFLWIDCDALISRFDQSVDDILKDLNTTSNHHIVVAQDPHTEFNSGVMFVRNSEWSRDLWKRTLQKASDDAIRHHKWWEQQALLEVYRENQHEETLRILITPHRWKINAFRTPRRNDYNESSFAWHRVNCREQPTCSNLIEAFFCSIMPNGSYPVDIVDCAHANFSLFDTF